MNSTVYGQSVQPAPRRATALVRYLSLCLKAHRTLADAYMQSAIISSGTNSVVKQRDNKG